MKLFVSALEYSANVHLRHLLREMVGRENIDLCGIFDEKLVGNLSWGMQFTRRFPPCFVNGPQVLFPSKGQNAVQSHTAITSIVDSASQNLGENPRISHEVRKSFCYFWLKPKVESSLPLKPQSTKKRNFAESPAFSISGTSLCDTNALAVMGFVDVLKKAKFFLELRQKCLNLALSSDKILLMDSSSFNIPLAKHIKKCDKNKPIMYYILPQVWAWKPWRAKVIEANCDKLAAILPFEVGFYKEKAEFVGHPLLDEIKNFRGLGNLFWGMRFRTCENFWDSADYQSSVRPKNSHKYKSHTAITSIEILHSQNLGDNPRISHEVRKSFCYFWQKPKVAKTFFRFCVVESGGKNHAKSAESHTQNIKNADSTTDSPIFSFMPGSRLSEIKRIFPIFLQVKDELKRRDKSARFHLIIPQKFASQNPTQIYGDISDFDISFDAHRSLFQSRFAFICSGTATLECALIGTPFVLGYKCRALEAFIARCFLRIKFIGLANILYEKIAPNERFHDELIQRNLTAKNLLKSCDCANADEFLRKSLALRKYLKCGSARLVAKMLYDL